MTHRHANRDVLHDGDKSILHHAQQAHLEAALNCASAAYKYCASKLLSQHSAHSSIQALPMHCSARRYRASACLHAEYCRPKHCIKVLSSTPG